MAQMMADNGQRLHSRAKDPSSSEKDWCGLIGCIVKWKKSKLQKEIYNVLLFMKKERKMRLAICGARWEWKKPTVRSLVIYLAGQEVGGWDQESLEGRGDSSQNRTFCTGLTLGRKRRRDSEQYKEKSMNQK